jgi:hypothetical protein
VNVDWDLFDAETCEGQELYTIVDSEGTKHWLDNDDAGHLLDSLNGHAAPTALSRLVEARLR